MVTIIRAITFFGVSAAQSTLSVPALVQAAPARFGQWVTLACRLSPGQSVRTGAEGARPGRALGGPGFLRVTFGTRAENERFVEALRVSLS